MSAIHADRRGGDRRSPGRRIADHRALERERKRMRLADPVSIALWELEQERAARDTRERVTALRGLLGFKYGAES
jgi:hypothetical protein